MKYGTDWREEIAADEETRFAQYARDLADIQASRDAKYSEKGRALHRKAIGGFRATFTVRDDLAAVLPPELHLGPFKAGAKYDAYVRFSNGSWERSSDKRPDIRGCAIKLLGVGGKKALTETEEPRTQDFLLIHVPTIAANSVDDFIAFAKVASHGREGTLPLRLAWAIGPVRAVNMIRRALATFGVPFGAYGSAPFFSASPYRFGPTAARWALAPLSQAPAADPGRDGQREALNAAVRNGLAWNFQVQLYQDATRTPIERNDVEWKAADAPFLSLGKLEIPPTDPDSAESKAVHERVEAMAFDLWHTVEELRPLGAFNRARKHAYFVSTQARGAVPEPTS